MTGYTPAEQAIRDARGLPSATGADDPPAWHDQPRPCNRRNAHTNHGACPGTAPEFPREAVEEVTS
jgi:hypothetical protein